MQPSDVKTLPVYSILVPVYHEAPVMYQLACALKALDWPLDRLDIQLLFERDDTETLLAALRAPFPFGTRFTVVPPGGPRTKPNALDYGLAGVKGELVCVYDAEDCPAPDQLKAAYSAFRTCNALACVQAPLHAGNGQKSLIAAHWALEYAVQFGLLLPALAKLRAPVLIGGTSNHFRTRMLLAVGGWDRWNVTEDADLSIRLARAGFRIGMITPETLESAPESFAVWVAQRSRWIKGFMQTWLVLIRQPVRAIQQMGFPAFVIVQLCLGGAIFASFLYGPVLLLVCLTIFPATTMPGPASYFLLVAGLGVGWLSDILAPGRWSWARLAAIFTRPVYWPLHSVAACRALWGLVSRPCFWAKTPHKPHVKPRAILESTRSRQMSSVLSFPSGSALNQASKPIDAKTPHSG